MKKSISFLLAYILTILIVSAQEYSKSSIEPEIGVSKIRDVTSVQPFNADLGVRYMTNTLFGVKLNGNYANVEDYEYYSAGLHGVVNVGRLLEFESFTDNYTILSGVGGTYTYSKEPTNLILLHRLSNFHLSAFVDNEFKLNNTIFLRLGLDVVTGVNSRPFIITNSTETTTILNFNAGVTINLGKKEHADWYLKPDVEPIVNTIMLQPTVIDKTVTNYYPIKSKEIEYVFFDNDSHSVDKSGLNAIVKASDKLTSVNVITVIGYASPPASDAYNLELSKQRALAVIDKLISIGIQKHQITLKYEGEITTKNDKNIDLSRRVALIVE